jgi:hypothetical protein
MLRMHDIPALFIFGYLHCFVFFRVGPLPCSNALVAEVCCQAFDGFYVYRIHPHKDKCCVCEFVCGKGIKDQGDTS